MAPEAAVHELVVLGVPHVAGTQIDTLVGRCSEDACLPSSLGAEERQTVVEDAAQEDAPGVVPRIVVAEEKADAVALLRGSWGLEAVIGLLAVHQRKAEPRIRAIDKLAEDLRVDACHIGRTLVLAGIAYLHIIHHVGDVVRDALVVALDGELERALVGLERVVPAQDDLPRTLRTYVLVHLHHLVAVLVGVAQAILLVEGRLVVEAGCDACLLVAVVAERVAKRGAWRHEEFLVEGPVAQANATLQQETSVPGIPSVGVLHEGRKACRGALVGRMQVLDHAEFARIARQAVAHRVAAFPFGNLVVDLLALHGHAVGESVAGNLCVALERKRHHTCLQIVACMLHVTSHAEACLAHRSRLVHPVFARDVVGHLLVGHEGRSHQLQACVPQSVVAQGQGAEERVELVLLVSVEIDLEAVGHLVGAEGRLAAFGCESVVVHGDVAQETEVPLLVFAECPGQERLVVEEDWVIFALCVQRIEYRGVALVAKSVQLGEVAKSLAQCSAAACQADHRLGIECFGTSVGDVEHRTHLVAIFARKASRREIDGAHHGRVDERKSFLLAAGDELGTIDLDAVHIDQVFVERPAAHIVLRREFVVHVHTCLCAYQVLDGVAAGRTHVAHVLHLDVLHVARSRLSSGGHFHVTQHRLVGLHLHIQLQSARAPFVGLHRTGVYHPFHALIAQRGEDDAQGVRVGHLQLVFALEVGERADAAAQQAHMNDVHGLPLLVGHRAIDSHLSPQPRHRHRGKHNQTHYYIYTYAHIISAHRQ